jgi:hypothetical protein
MLELVKGLKDRTHSRKRQPQSGDKKSEGFFNRECTQLQGNQEANKGQGKPAKPIVQDGKRGEWSQDSSPAG